MSARSEEEEGIPAGAQEGNLVVVPIEPDLVPIQAEDGDEAPPHVSEHL